MLCSECKIWDTEKFPEILQTEKGLFSFSCIVRINNLFSITVAVKKLDLYPYLMIRRPCA